MTRNKKLAHILLVSVFIFAGSISIPAENIDSPFEEWSREYSLKILNESPWAKNQTYIRQIGGIGSGIQGEKEIYSTYFVRFLSAEPVRKAFARIKQLHIDYENLNENQKKAFDTENQKTVDLDLEDWIVVSVAFRSNVPREESEIDQFLMGQTTETVKNRAYLSTKKFPRLEISQYIPPQEKIVGAKFVFPKTKNGQKVVSSEDEKIVFEFDPPDSGTILRMTFDVQEMIEGGEVIL